jgi:hypothetical protein
MYICIDFDGSCTTHDYPNIGKDIGAVPILKRIVERGHKLILFTMRSDNETRQTLTEAVDWFKINEIPLYGINTNPTQKFWTTSPKAYGEIYIDDAGISAPLIYNTELSNRPYLDWNKIEEVLIQRGVL